jgi:hypothetical protein
MGLIPCDFLPYGQRTDVMRHLFVARMTAWLLDGLQGRQLRILDTSALARGVDAAAD